METGLKENTVSKRKTGIYSGSFNPVHIGHLALANWLCEFTELDELWFLITPHNPLKEKEELMDDRLRYELVKKSIHETPILLLDDVLSELDSNRQNFLLNPLIPSTHSGHWKQVIRTVNSISSWVRTIGNILPGG